MLNLLLFLLVAAAASYYFVFYNKLLDDEWRKLPDLATYLNAHPECKTSDDENAKCSHCGSDKVIFQPLTMQSDPRINIAVFLASAYCLKVSRLFDLIAFSSLLSAFCLGTAHRK